MSLIKIRIFPQINGLAIPRTTVKVDGKYAYQTITHPNTEHEHLMKLMELLGLELEIESTDEPQVK